MTDNLEDSLDIAEQAYQWARENKNSIIDEFVKGIAAVENPVSFFMAGSPGAGKTEHSKSFIEDLNKLNQQRFGIDYPILELM